MSCVPEKLFYVQAVTSLLSCCRKQKQPKKKQSSASGYPWRDPRGVRWANFASRCCSQRSVGCNHDAVRVSCFMMVSDAYPSLYVPLNFCTSRLHFKLCHCSFSLHALPAEASHSALMLWPVCMVFMNGLCGSMDVQAGSFVCDTCSAGSLVLTNTISCTGSCWRSCSNG